MTELEHAIKHIKTRADAWAVKEVTEALQSISERLDKALSQEPCDDVVSRKAVDELSKELVHTTRDKADFLCNFWEGLQKLPPVTQKPIECVDAISRDAVLDAIEREDKWLLAAKGHNGLTEIAFSGLKARVDASPSVTQKSGKWIPVSDRLPEEYGEYLITWKNPKYPKTYIGICECEITDVYDHEHNRFEVEWLFDEYITTAYPDSYVVAWQPLPEPYQKGGK